MENTEIQNLIKELIEKTTISVNEISIVPDGDKNTWFSVEVKEPHFFINHDGEALSALNHLVRRIIEKKIPRNENLEANPPDGRFISRSGDLNILIDINGFQKKKVENIRAVAHMMAERARYFKSNVEIDPMSAFERRIVHEFLATATDLKTESMGYGPSRRVVIKYLNPNASSILG